MNEDCEWPAETPVALDAGNSRDRRHLVHDVKVAEELGVRYADVRLARGRAKTDGPRTRDECDASLFNEVARLHSVTLEEVLRARQQLVSKRWDPAIHLPLAALYLWGTYMTARWIRRRFPPDEMAAACVATVCVSLVLSSLVLALGHLWGGMVEMMRLGNTHMTYRAQRLGWRGFAPHLFAVGVLMFWIVVVVDYARPNRRRQGYGGPP